MWHPEKKNFYNVAIFTYELQHLCVPWFFYETPLIYISFKEANKLDYIGQSTL